MKKKKIIKLDIDELMSQFYKAELEVNDIAVILQDKELAVRNEWKKFEAKQVPDIKVIEGIIDEAKPLYERFYLAVEEHHELKNQIINLTGLKEYELIKLKDNWFYNKKLNEAREFVGFAI